WQWGVLVCALLTHGLHVGHGQRGHSLLSASSITKPESKTVLINCHISDPDFNNVFIHWYRKRPNAAPKRIAYMSSKLFLENHFNEGKFSIEKDPAKSVCTLMVSKITLQDSATYYCASGYYNKVFGSGTKLIVSGKLHAIFHATKQSRPANFEILQKEHKNQIMYVCLIEKFYPDVIRVTWTDKGNKIVEGDNIVKGDAWKPTKEDKYSISSWLTVPAEKKDENYYCNYEHETGKESVTKQGI
uniref:Ig-like domain-containing protein n=1 Tax=Calidris pygmaea TaxID=425635 RepID=A0A8C3KK30_9CHAR